MMKKLLLITLNLLIVSLGISQISAGGEPISKKFLESKKINTVTLEAVSQQWIDEAAETDGKNGAIERVAKNIPTNLNPYNSGTWETLKNGDKLWRLQITATNALGINALFKDFSLAQGSKLFVYSPNYKQVIGAFNETNNDESKLFSTEIIFGNTLILEYLEPKNQANRGFFTIENIGSFYKSTGFPNQDTDDFNNSEYCEINVNCSEGSNWQDEKKGVARILVRSSAGQGWCTGTLVNNTNADCTPYFLTAYHCGDNSTTSHFNQWVFYFNFEFSGCSGTIISPTTSQSMIGASLKARSNDLNSTTTSSDFLLLELNQSVPASYDPYYNGWNNINSAPNGGVGIHHPAGDVKKISTFTETPTNTGVTWADNGNGYSTPPNGVTHWEFAWAATANGHGVTEGGSSGSPLFNNNGEVVGTLTGGGSYCTQQTSEDQYGKMSYHWQSNATASNRQLKPWLDPTNSGVTSLVGTYPPCTIVATDDAGITVVNQPTGTICGTTFSPEVELKNFGTNTLTAVTINYQINSLATQSYSWSGSLTQNATTTVSLPNMTSPAGTNTFTSTTNNPNGNTDNNNANNSITESYTTSAINSLPLSENFETTTFPSANWTLYNPDSDKTWKQSTTIGTGTGTKSMFIDNWSYDAVDDLDWLISESYDFSTVTNPTLTFDLAYAYYQQTNGSNISYDSLGIAISTNCGDSYYWLWKEGGDQLATAGGLGIEFEPAAGDWENRSIDITSLIGENSVQFAFIAKNGYGNNLYIDNINITNVAPPVAAFTANTTSVCVGESITFTDQTTNNPSSWNWNFSGAATNSSTQNPTVTFNTAGTYTISLSTTNTDGTDSEIKTNYITVSPNPTIGSYTSNNLSCYGDNSGEIIVNMTSGQAPYLYAINNGSNQNSNTFSSLDAGNYSFLVTDNNGCTTTGNTSISEPSILTLSTNNLNPAYCNLSNGSVTLNATGGTSSYTYSIDGNNYQNSSTFNNLSEGNYNGTVKDANGCIKDITIVIANVIETFTTTIQTTNAACGVNNGIASATVNGTSNGYTFLWDNNQTTVTATGLSFGTHSVTLTNTNGCSETTSFNIENVNAPIVSIQTEDILCFGLTTGSASATISGGTPGYTLNWSFGGDSLTETNLDQGDYSLTVIDDASCQTATDFTITEPPILSMNFNKTDEHCSLNDGMIEVVVSGGTSPYEYNWDNLSTGNIINQLTEGNYAVTVNDNNDCIVQASTSLINVLSPTISNAIITDVSCGGENSGQVLIDVINGSSPIQAIWSDGSENEDLTNVIAGNYSITLTDAFGCSSDSSFIIEEPEALNLLLNIVDNSPNGISTITANATGGIQAYEYEWSTGEQTQVITNLTTGLYTITVSDANKCSVDSTIAIGNVAIEDTDFIEFIKLFPNPSTHILHLEIQLKNSAPVNINVLNTLGQSLYYKENGRLIQHTETLDVSRFANGIYYIEIEIDNQIEMLKFIKAN